MAMKIFVNLPVEDLDRSTAFFKRLGFTFNPQFTDSTAACMVVTDDIYVMLLIHPKFKEFTKKGSCYRSLPTSSLILTIRRLVSAAPTPLRDRNDPILRSAAARRASTGRQKP